MKRRLVIAGGNGFLGGLLANHFTASGDEVVVLTRRPATSGPVRAVRWDGETPGPWVRELGEAVRSAGMAGA